ncbi:MAG: immunity 17 family protein [Bacteroidia bacterium]
MQNTLLSILVAGAGAYSIVASINDWEFFFKSRRATLFVKMFGRKGARIFFSLLGLFMFFLAFKIYASPN